MSAVLLPEIVPPETAELKVESLALVKAAKALEITTLEGYTAAGRELQRVADVRKGIVYAFKDAKAAAHEAHKKITKLEADILAGPAEAERIYKSKMATFYREEEGRRREAEARERERQRKIEEERQLAEAIAHEAAGEHEEAKAVFEQEVAVPVVELPKPVAAGVQMRKTWAWRYTSESQTVNCAFHMNDEKKISRFVKALGKDAASQVGGIEVYEDLIPAVSTGS